jgi:rSAM/selenodomain-associated transferase 1
MKKHLIVYAKRPLPGYAKTRLGAKIGAEESAGVYARFLYRCLLELVELDLDEFSIELSLAASEDIAFFELAFPEFQVNAQIGMNLGQRFTHSFSTAFEKGADAVVVIGTDIPDLDRSIIRAAFAGLEEKDVVIGPDTDGGYYLIGTRDKTAILFNDIHWSSEFVYQRTEQLIQSQGLTLHRLPVLSDVDTEADFRRWLALMK